MFSFYIIYIQNQVIISLSFYLFLGVKMVLKR